MATPTVRVTLGAVPQAVYQVGLGQKKLVHAMSDAAVNEGAALAWRGVAARTPKNLGLLVGSLGVERSTLGGTPVAFVGFTGAPSLYAQFVEEGRAAGKFPPRGDGVSWGIEFWARRKLGDAKAWYPVARKIARRGTEGKFMVRDTLAIDGDRIRGAMMRAAVRAMRTVLGNAA